MKHLYLKLYCFIIVRKFFKVIKFNHIKLDTFLKGSKLEIKGYDNNIEIQNGSYKRVKIGINGNNNSIFIEKGVYIRNLHIIISGDNHKIFIGKNTEIGGCQIVCCGEDSNVTISKDCLLASNIEMRTCDGHAIYQDGKIINNSKDITIDEHVWIAQNVKILKGVKICRDSVVGINSLLTSNLFKSNVIIGGIPAKIIKENINWSKESTS
jgi:acetyltransferase-like isoleucine patch superfamily enzyme